MKKKILLILIIVIAAIALRYLISTVNGFIKYKARAVQIPPNVVVENIKQER